VREERLGMNNPIHSYRELQQKIHQDLRVQHPEWVQPNGDCPLCDSYELRLAELLNLSRRIEIRNATAPARIEHAVAA
jgi:hypothetical protein